MLEFEPSHWDRNWIPQNRRTFRLMQKKVKDRIPTQVDLMN